MQDIRFTIEEYEQSRMPIQKRIQELNALIAKGNSPAESNCMRNLLERRSTLYTELWSIEHTIRELREYIFNTQQREVNKKVG